MQLTIDPITAAIKLASCTEMGGAMYLIDACQSGAREVTERSQIK